MIVMVDLPMAVREGGTQVRSPEDTAILPEVERIAGLAQEAFVVILMDRKNREMGIEMVSLGARDASLVDPVLVFRQAIIKVASSILMVHNHPSGDTTPSAEDLAITRRMVDAGRLLEIPVLDHIVVGMPRGASYGGNKTKRGVSYTSLRETGLVQFGK